MLIYIMEELITKHNKVIIQAIIIGKIIQDIITGTTIQITITGIVVEIVIVGIKIVMEMDTLPTWDIACMELTTE